MESSTRDKSASMESEQGESPARGSNRWPDFFIIGAAKSGTTTLHDYLARHPSLWMSSPKEPRFFDRSFPKERRDPKVYQGLFEGAGEAQYCAESSVNYSMWPTSPDVPRSIHAVAPNARFIYMLREPLKRCYSHFRHAHERHKFPGQPYRMTFEEYLEFDPVVAHASDYAAQVQQYLAYFPKSSILLLPFERFAKDPAWALRQVCEFLGVEDRSWEMTEQPIHSNSTGRFEVDMSRNRLLSPFRRVPGLRSLYRNLSPSLREKSVGLLENSFLGRRDKRRFQPPPILPATRERLRERFDASTEYLVREFDFDTSWWVPESA